VSYCHWKSNEAILASVAGVNDLDLLVARRDETRFRMVLAELGFVQVRPPKDREILGIEDYLGRDPSTGMTVHVQPHYELVVGDDMTKTFRLPIERPYLGSARTDDVLPVPDPTFEYLVFLIRMVVKHCPLEAIVSRKGRLTNSERRELQYLEDRVRWDQLAQVVAGLLPFLDPDELADWRRALEPGTGVLTRSRAGRAAMRRLATHSRRPLALDAVMKTWRRLRRGFESWSGHSKGKTPAAGGLVIGVVGGDGSGKSTLVARLGEALGGQLHTHNLHLGKPRRSLVTRALARPLELAKRRHGARSGGRLPGHGFPGYAAVVAGLLLARDRHRTYVTARRLAGRGGVVVIDRFPLAGIRMMDSPRLQDLAGADRRSIAAWMVRREQAYYQEIRPPDLLLVLRVDPDVAVERRGDQDPEYVRRRAEEIWGLDWSQTGAFVLDASQSADLVFAQASQVVWDHL
jgi:thymidylate kinase